MMPIEPAIAQPLISVIIPTYNRPAYLADAIKSAVQQTYRNIEIIVSDDCSAEDPQVIVDSFQDERIRFRRNSSNLGVALNIYSAIQETRGKYVASLNDDDIWDKEFLERLVAPLEANSELSLAFCDYYTIDPDGTINHEQTKKQTRQEKRDRITEGIYQPFWKLGLVERSIFIASAAVIRKDAVAWTEIAEAGVFWDYYIIYLASRSGRGTYYCPQKLSHYRLSANSILRSPDPQAKIRRGKAGIYCNSRFIEDPALKEFRSYFQQQLAKENTSTGIGFMRVRQLQKARPYFWYALKQQKFNLRTIVALALSFAPPTIASRF